MERMVKLSPDNAEWKRDLAWFDAQIVEAAGPAVERQPPPTLPKAKRGWLSGLF